MSRYTIPDKREARQCLFSDSTERRMDGQENIDSKSAI